MIDPQLIFQQPEKYLDQLRHDREGSFFDRKEVRTEGKGLQNARRNIRETLSAFTNARGGVLVLGIADDGQIPGINHLNENEVNSLVQVPRDLINHQINSKYIDFEGKRLLIFFAPEGMSGVCETIEDGPKSWIRQGENNLPLSPHQKEALLLERNKKWEQLGVCDASLDLVNQEILRIFKQRYLEEQDAAFAYDDLEFLRVIGASKEEQGRSVFTNAGFLFLAQNPSSLIPSAQVRFLRYQVESSHYEEPGNPTFDKTFDGCLPDLLRKIRTFVNEGAFFKKYVYRNPYQSGIVEEPELPPNAVEEVIVNALIHRDYHQPLPITCMIYQDAFVVRNPGRLLQPDFIPTSFTLDQQTLLHYPRNPKIAQWARTMVDERGQRFVKLLSEGNRTIRQEMRQLNLPAPAYHTNGFTTVTLYNNSREREEKMRQQSLPAAEEFTNLFPIQLTYHVVKDGDDDTRTIRNQLRSIIRDKLRNLGWFIDRDSKSRLTVHQKGQNIPLNDLIDKVIRIFPAYDLQVYEFAGSFFLSIDYTIQQRSISRLNQLLNHDFHFAEKRALIQYGGTWTEGIIESVAELQAVVRLPEYDMVEEIPLSDIIPSLNRAELSQMAHSLGFPIEKKVKELSLASQANASKERAEKIMEAARFFASRIFPIGYNGFTASLNQRPQELSLGGGPDFPPFSLYRDLKEPEAKFQNNHTDQNILSGLTRFGAAEHPRREVEIIPFCLTGFEESCQRLIQTLQRGQMNFQGMERTFGTSLTYTSTIVKADAHDFLPECKRLLSEHPDWAGNQDLNRLFLIHVPEDRYPATDPHSPYFILKKYLLSQGVPVQMVDSGTLQNPKFKDLNLALNINAKTGGVPWVLPNALPEADCFIGLSYAQYRENDRFSRTMGYVNVFDRYGQWQFYKGNSKSFDFEEKHIHLADLVRQALQQHNNLSDTASIHIHYTNKFSKLDRASIVQAVQEIRPRATVTFVWINLYHNLRMFDNRIEGNGSLSRGSYVITRKQQMYLSTTGYTPLKKTLGTPLLLEVNTRTEPYYPEHQTPFRSIAQHLLALTKLNWSSTQSINALPVTLRYAHEIAHLTSMFRRSEDAFSLHPVLERTPWFI